MSLSSHTDELNIKFRASPSIVSTLSQAACSALKKPYFLTKTMQELTQFILCKPLSQAACDCSLDFSLEHRTASL